MYNSFLPLIHKAYLYLKTILKKKWEFNPIHYRRMSNFHSIRISTPKFRFNLLKSLVINVIAYQSLTVSYTVTKTLHFTYQINNATYLIKLIKHQGKITNVKVQTTKKTRLPVILNKR